MASTDTMSEAPGRSRRRSSRSSGKKQTRKAAKRRASPRRANKRVAEDQRSMLSGMMDMAHFADDAAMQARRYVRDGARGAQRAITDAQHFATDSIDGALAIGGRYGGMLAERFREQPLATVAGLGAMAVIAAWLMGGRRQHAYGGRNRG